MDADLSIVVCARNEEADVATVLGRLRECFPAAELILVDNGSTDDTARLAQGVSGVIVVQEAVPGKGGAMRAGAARATRAWLLFHDADLEYEVKDSVRVVWTAMQNERPCTGFRMVAYDRILASSWLANKLIRALLKLKTGVDVPDVLSGTRCLRTEAFRRLNTQSVRFGIETEITRGLLAGAAPVMWEPVRFYPRSAAAGKKIRVWHLLELIRQALKSTPR